MGLGYNITTRPTPPPSHCASLPDWSRHPRARMGGGAYGPWGHGPGPVLPHPTAPFQALHPSALHELVHCMGRGG